MVANSVPDFKIDQYLSLVNRYSQIHLKREGNKLLLILPKQEAMTTINWSSLVEQLKCRLHAVEKAWQEGSRVDLLAGDRLLDQRQLQTLEQLLREFKLELQVIITSRRQTAVTAAMAGYSVSQAKAKLALEQETPTPTPKLNEPLYLENTVRSGVEVRHPGSVIIWGDVNPGGTVIADGDILVWGSLRGLAHAGAKGNRYSKIMALKMKPTQLRIGDIVARGPTNTPSQWQPEMAFLAPDGIRLVQGFDFIKNHSFSQRLQAWISVRKQELLE